MPSRPSALRRALLSLTALLVVGPAAATAVQSTSAAAPAQRGPDDAVVIAVIDSAFTPYHYDFLASKMPQARNSDRSDDLPLGSAPHTWLPGFPSPATFDSYTKLSLSLPRAEDDSPEELDKRDAAKWAGIKGSRTGDINYYWLPGTKVVGALTFAATGDPVDELAYGGTGTINGPTSSHGTGTTSVSVGNLHGACPECLVVFIQYADPVSAERAIDWAMNQPWIDGISNSYGFSAGIATRDRIYNGSSVGLQKAASTRGQTIFFSAGNGMENAFTTPNNTLLSSQEGPDWIVTVTATDPNGGTYTGTGKPADVAGIGHSYPSAYDAETAGGKGQFGFGGTSNATPTIAGTYGRALYRARRALPGRSRVQAGGVVARGPRITCGKARPGCELGDGVLTANELRMRLLQSAVSTGKGFTDGPVGVVPPGPQVADSRWAAEGHGTYTVRLRGDDVWNTEFNRLWQPMIGAAAAPRRPAGEREWFIHDSWCRQHIWGEWSGGYWRKGMARPAAGPDSPATAAYREVCPALGQPPQPVRIR